MPHKPPECRLPWPALGAALQQGWRVALVPQLSSLKERRRAGAAALPGTGAYLRARAKQRCQLAVQAGCDAGL